MAPTYINDEEPAKIGKGETDENKASLTSADAEAASASLPPGVRAAFAAKVWTLLAMQMCITFIICLVIEALVDKPSDSSKGVLIWIGSSVVCFLSLGLLSLCRNKQGLNYALLVVAFITTGAFWGLAKFIVQGYFNINVMGICTVSLLGSAACNISGLTNTVGTWLKPKKGRVSNYTGRDGGSKTSGGTGSKTPKLSRQDSKFGSVKTSVVQDLVRQNDGVMRATMLLGIVTWLIGWVVCLVVTLLIKDKEKTKDASMGSALAAGGLAFFMLLFFHFDCDRHMRKSSLDDFLAPIIETNSDLVLVFILLYIIAIFLACNDQSMEMRMEGGGEGGMEGAGGDVGMEGGAGAEPAGADTAGVTIGGDGV